MRPYVGVVHRDGGSAYDIAFPDAPGCVSAAIDLWLESVTGDRAAIPHPRDVAEIRADPAWAEAFADAALVIAVRSSGSALRDAA